MADYSLSSSSWSTLNRWVSPFIVSIYLLIALGYFIFLPISAFQSLFFSSQEGTVHPYDFIIVYITGVIFLACSIWVFRFYWQLASGLALSLFLSAAAISILGSSYANSTLFPSFLWPLSTLITCSAITDFSLHFPTELNLLDRFPRIKWAIYTPPIIFVLLTLIFQGTYSLHNQQIVTVSILGLGITFLSLVLLLVRSFQQWLAPQTSTAHEKARIVLGGFALSSIPVVLWTIYRLLGITKNFPSWVGLLLTIFPISLVIAFTPIQIPSGTKYRNVVYGILTILVTAGISFIVWGISLIIGRTIAFQDPLFIGFLITTLVVIINPLRELIQKQVDSVIFRENISYQRSLQRFTHEITDFLEIPEILHHLRKYVNDSFHPNIQHIFVYDDLTEQYIASTDLEDSVTTDIIFSNNSPIVNLLTKSTRTITFNVSDTIPASIQYEQARLKILGTSTYIPLPGRRRLVGWLALGGKASGESFSRQDAVFLETLCDQTALAVERAQVVNNLEQQINQTNILIRLAQGINVTIHFDDILELIYAQTKQLIPFHDYRLTLLSIFDDSVYHAFYVESDERLNAFENKALSQNLGLEIKVIHSRQSLIIDNFERASQSYGLLPEDENIFAWMGAPLNAGAETIGAISLGSRNPNEVYTDKQLNLLQAIADQAAGAIVKARSLEIADRRAKQLATLNDIGQSLTSTLEIQPLLNQILVSATKILNCDAGSLFMVDQTTGELVFEVTIGPVANDLIGQRLPPGTGIVGEAAENNKPIIANDVRRSKGWYSEPDQKTGFVTKDLLVAPMRLKKVVIGVIEVINKRDGFPFDQDDRDLLSTFASQAAIAFENARLYTQTDQALNARLDELSVIQRIDRELNTSLDLDRALNITLNWALRQSKSHAGLIGMVDSEQNEDPPTIKLMVWKDLSNDPDVPSKSPLFINNGEQYFLYPNVSRIKSAIQTLEPQNVSFNLNRSSSSIEIGEITPDSPGPQADNNISHKILDTSTGQLIIPIQRKTEILGVIILERIHSDPYHNDIISFLLRLSDHAAIAISNAQLYADLQSANQAKTEFVSLVSHELKTPMTSIRGYTDLLAQEAVGPINELQENFLATIRSNVNRMATLVSDLADVSRIESNRLRLDFQYVSIADIIQEVISSSQAQVNAKQQTIDLNIPESLPEVWGDQGRIIQIFSNLISNANKYTPTGGQITIIARHCANTYDPDGATEVVHILVKDTGFGISAEDQEHIFYKFFRSEDENIRAETGTGLGLNITQHLVTMQGGTMWFESELSKGSTFHFTIPVADTI